MALVEKLVHAIEDGDVGKVQQVLEMGADVNQRAFALRPPLHVAMDRRSATDVILQFLLSSGADINATDKFGNTPLHIAAELGDAAKVSLLMRPVPTEAATTTSSTTTSGGGGSFSAVLHMSPANDSRVTPLHNAAAVGSVPVIQLLTSAGANVSARDIYGSTPLHNAAEENFADCIRALVKAGADINAESHKGNTPLLRAAWRGHVDACQALLDLGANAHHKSASGKTALALAQAAKFPDVVALLESHMQRQLE